MSEQGLLIALSGKMHSGKTTASLRFVETGKWERIRFSGPFKSMIYNFLILCKYDEKLAFECVDGSFKNTKLPDLGLTMRWLFQMVGSGFPQYFNYPNIWSNISMLRAKNIRKNKNVIIDDLRFQHEDDDIHAVGGKTILILGNHDNIKRKTEIGILSEIYDHSNYISDKIFKENMIKAWDNTFSDMKLERINKDIRSLFIDFINETVIPSRNTELHIPESHCSENSFPSFYNYQINNNGSLADLYDKVDSLIIRLGN